MSTDDTSGAETALAQSQEELARIKHQHELILQAAGEGI